MTQSYGSDVFVYFASGSLANNLKNQFGEKMVYQEGRIGTASWRVKMRLK